MNFTIRKARKKDALAILSLIKHLANFERAPEEVTTTVEDIQRDGFGKHSLFDVFVAEVKKEVVGMALYYNRYSTWKGRTIHLEDLIVYEEYRKQKIGSALYDAVLKEAYEEKVKRVEWVVLDWNAPAQDFYTKSGAKVLKYWQIVQMNEKELEGYINSTKNEGI